MGNINLFGIFRFSVEETLILPDIIFRSNNIDGLTPWRKVIFEKSSVALILNTFPTSYRTRNFTACSQGFENFFYVSYGTYRIYISWKTPESGGFKRFQHSWIRRICFWKSAVCIYVYVVCFNICIVTYGLVASHWLCKQRPLLGKARNLHATIEKRYFLCGTHHDHFYAMSR
jgi:hypothetical protein